MAKGLGKGLNALFNSGEISKDEIVREIKLRELRPNPYQPRKSFRLEAIEELKQSIMEHGILQPIIARKSIKGYEIVAGERRYRAAKEADLKTVPVVVRELSEQQMMELAILENLQREDLNPIEEAAAYQTLLEKLEFTQEQLANRLGKSRPHIANHVRLLSLPEGIRRYISDGEISMGHGRALLGLKKKEMLKPVADKVLKEGMNVRQLEQYIHQLNDTVSRETKPKKQEKKDIFIKQRETSLRERLGTSVTIKQSKKKGKIEIEFFSKEDLERILNLIDQENLSS
ncbi:MULTISPECIES: ParB/RepB/Spo0J family partition protein [Peribacillus]|jgi:ParB family transcriptional regulator, chromosome partitioning protein|uniref:ParB/RepB/Spo0J family partition protein n=1 Tax=Peribacillus castrilensis TaxID=2897690 RepID=A0AAW9MZ48_9BACI|nr:MULTISPECIES: ParB/RepB/Spo0J family partition protein [Peribacillus]MBD8138379.1 ParB/RepB/Spo0J family partition protein [Bacillus sp. CFBP 13597]MEC0271488.1 ParB/RepB/Spo0J family partition protein [Peribacillus castrilensis]PEO49984.1 chromosome partitioning protein ParB [Bacillus sp. AFS026049]MBX9953809.1 ParB/RepB/Spo0J family partition protein [Peribacillus simplex]MCK2018944.1 ParB/RepB/Spo0J family partition protein [Peribacillus frigoritolerans]